MAAPDGEPVQKAPHPHVAQNQSDAHEQQLQQWATGRRADPDFVHLAIADFDAEAFAIGLVNSLERPWLDSPIGVQVCPPSVAFSCPRIVLVDDGERHGGGAVEGAVENLIDRRLKQTGARWRVRRVNRMATLCSAFDSDHWDAYWNFVQN